MDEKELEKDNEAFNTIKSIENFSYLSSNDRKINKQTLNKKYFSINIKNNNSLY